MPSPWTANASSLGSAASLNVDGLEADVWFSPPGDSDCITSAVRYFDEPSAIPNPTIEPGLFLPWRFPSQELSHSADDQTRRRRAKRAPLARSTVATALTINPTRLSRP